MEEGGQHGSGGLVSGGMGVKVMTDEQMEMLRKQISVYATICDRLVDMHKAVFAQQDLTGLRLGNTYCDPLLSTAINKIPSRQRWTPRPAQLEILERIFEQSNTTPSRQKIKEITVELAQHGQISETNVYNWFQNRRARSKRKQLAPTPSNGETEVDTEVESGKDKNTKPEEFQIDDTSSSMVNHAYFHSPEIGIDQLIGKAEIPMSYSPYWQVDHYEMLD